MKRTKKRVSASVRAARVVLAASLVALAAVPVGAQTAISANGVVESTTGGFKFPDGTVQVTAAAADPAPVEDTGQQTCWDGAGTLIACSGTGQDGELQRGLDWPAPRFTDNDDGTATDNLTGLIWLKSTNCLGLRTWVDALADVNALMTGACGLADDSLATEWRMPNAKELLSLVDYGESSPALPLGHPFTDVQTTFYWSSSSGAAFADSAWALFVTEGNLNGALKTGHGFVWPVRGGQ